MTSPEPRADMMRRVNDLIAESLWTGGRADPVAFFCECSEPGCYRSVWLTPAAYEEGKRDPAWLALASEHTAPVAV